MTSLMPEVLSARIAHGRYSLQRAEAMTLGISDAQLGRWCSDGVLESLGFGAYVINAPTTAKGRFEQDRELHLRRADAILTGLPGSYLVGRSAAWAWGAPLVQPPHRVEIARRPRLRSDRTVLASNSPWGRGAAPGHPRLQDPAEAAIEVASRHGAAAGLVVADALAHQGVPRTAFVEAAQRYGSRAGAPFARLVGAHVEPLTESPGESRLRWACASRGIRLVPQVEVRDGSGRFVARVDFLVEGTHVVVEFDGLGKYAEPEVLRAEKRRQVALERLGYVVVRFVHADLVNPDRVAKLVREAVERNVARNSHVGAGLRAYV